MADGAVLETRRGGCVRSVGGTVSFSASGGHLPNEVLAQAIRELSEWRGTGQGVLELPFTGPAFKDLQAGAMSSLRALLRLPEGYRVLFMQGGASTQFSLVPMNLLRGKETASYTDTGYWSKRAIAEALRYCRIELLPPHGLPATPGTAYLHVTSNETADGWQYREFPDTGGLPLVADMTSDFLTRPIDVSRFGLIYASAQKNIGVAGLTVVIVREDLLGGAHMLTPSAFDYRMQAQSDSLYNTPPVFAVHVAGLVFAWLLAQGGLESMQAAARRKSLCLYDVIDRSDGFYRCQVAPEARSCVSVCFRLAGTALTRAFLGEAESEGFLHLAGHSRVGGIRASLYNAVSEEAATALAEFMQDFANRRG